MSERRGYDRVVVDTHDRELFNSLLNPPVAAFGYQLEPISSSFEAGHHLPFFGTVELLVVRRTDAKGDPTLAQPRSPSRCRSSRTS